ncbi:uncharacterized protein G2W53_000753 [Senna tora]|uniref:Uncharacterized protein n=1 Tax=Senna tora TaxID=362788 RepID=A0A834XEP6_9FABA|nr:uncharacterized protein G2W53_000753 [Senna tora]
MLWWLLENAIDAVNVAHKRRRRSYFPSSAFGSTCLKCSILAQLIFLKSSLVHAFYSYSILHSLRIWPRRCFRPDLLWRWKGPSKAGGVCLIVVEECGDDEVKTEALNGGGKLFVDKLHYKMVLHMLEVIK